LFHALAEGIDSRFSKKIDPNRKHTKQRETVLLRLQLLKQFSFSRDPIGCFIAMDAECSPALADEVCAERHLLAAGLRKGLFSGFAFGDRNVAGGIRIASRPG
jgi:hypothetical protein